MRLTNVWILSNQNVIVSLTFIFTSELTCWIFLGQLSLCMERYLQNTMTNKNSMEHSNLKWVKWDGWMDRSRGGRRYRAPYGANNKQQDNNKLILSWKNFIYELMQVFVIGLLLLMQVSTSTQFDS